MKSSRSSSLPLLVVVSALGIATSGLAQPAAMSPPPRVPGNGNAMMIVEVSKLLDSPMANEQGWQAKLMKGYADRPLALPPMAKRMTVVAGMHPVGMQAVWQAALIEVGNPVTLEPMLREQGGYLDEIGGKRAAWTPRDVFYIEFDPKTLGIVRPGQRQLVTRWITGKYATPLSPYLKEASASAPNAQVIFAMDLDDFVGATAVRYAESMGQLPSLEKEQQGREALMRALASVRGVRLAMRVTDRINAEFTADFEQEVNALGDLAKPFVVDVLTLADVYEPAVEKWEFKAQGKKIVGTGPMEAEGLVRLLALLSPAHATAGAVATTATPETDGASPATASATAADPKLEAAQASQRYYRAIAGILDSISKKPSPTQGASWLIAKVRQIEQLPILNVDPALLEWGNVVADTLNRGAQELALGQQKAMIAAQGIASPVAYVSYSGDVGEGVGNAQAMSERRNVTQQRQAASQAQRGAAAERAFAILNPVLATRGKIRADMTKKYGVEF